MTTGVQTAYLAFQDRFRRVPGDWSAAGASDGIGEPITGGGNENGRLDNPPGANVYDEVNALWEQLSKAGIIKGRYLGTPGIEPTTNNQLAPVNVIVDGVGWLLYLVTPEAAAAAINWNVGRDSMDCNAVVLF